MAVQECLSLATHWLADEGWDVPPGYREVFTILAEHHVIEPALAARLASASGLRNLVAHRYGVFDWVRIHAIAREDLEDLLEFCAALARKASVNRSQPEARHPSAFASSTNSPPGRGATGRSPQRTRGNTAPQGTSPSLRSGSSNGGSLVPGEAS